jgi:hypothetical protein
MLHFRFDTPIVGSPLWLQFIVMKGSHGGKAQTAVAYRSPLGRRERFAEQGRCGGARRLPSGIRLATAFPDIFLAWETLPRRRF